jgi:asparagine synthase (glutamine-hydrolysing)
MKSIISVHPQPEWQIILGKINSTSDSILWQDDRLSIIAPKQIEPIPYKVFKDLVIIGDVWLSNHQELVNKINFDGTDLEIIVRLWHRYDRGCLDYLQGMFCLAIWHRERQHLTLVRDAVGAKTLYYTNQKGNYAIAPRLTNLLPYHDCQLDPIALRDYLCCAFVPGERTLWQNVKKLHPGEILELPEERIYPYWQLTENITEPHQTLDDYGVDLRQLLESVVKEYLPRDRAVGVFLSGGLDSSSITALVKRFHSHSVHTYSIHFGSECTHELEFSSLVANHCQTEHHILEITFAEMWSKLPETMALLDEPIGDPLTVPNLLLGQLAQRSVDIIFNGEGGDPCFGGPKNQPMLINSLYGGVARQNQLQAYLTSFQKCAVDLPKLLKPDVWQLVKDERSIFTEDLEDGRLAYLNRLMAINIKYKGADHILTKVNNLTQAAKLQPRSPLFDRRVVEKSMEIPPTYKLSGREEKAVLKAAVSDLLPSTIIERPKSGMMVPVQLGFKKYWHREAQGLLLDKKAKIADYLDRQIITEWLAYRGDTWNRYGVKLWLLTSLEVWLKINSTKS